MIDLIKKYNEAKKLQEKIRELKNDFDVVSDNANYYQDLLYKTRMEILEINYLVGANSFPLDGETENESWSRLTRSIIDKLKDAA